MKITGSLYQCHDCGLRFSGPHAFARHRTGEYAPSQRLCLTATDMRAAGMAPNAAGFWASERSAWPDYSIQAFAMETSL
jgi:hypothetical protein